MTSLARVAVVLLAAAAWPAPRDAVAGAVGAPAAGVLLDVPYLPQTPELCGGAAVAMVLRYWGERDVFPQDFAPLVGPGTGGILTGTLASAVHDRGWQTFVLPASDDTAMTRLQVEVDRRRPLIALIEVGPATYHYVVIVAVTDQAVVLHDPARAPFRVLGRAEFDRAWAGAGRWAMLVLPSDSDRSGDVVAHPEPQAASGAPHAVRTPCRALVDQGVTQARAGDQEGAESSLVVAAGLCPSDAAAWRELAGLRFAQARWAEAQGFGLAAVRLAPGDAHAWQIVATSRYLSGDGMGALDAWNRAGDPRIDTITLHGVERTPQPVVVRAAGWQPREVLTPDVFGRGLRRLRDLPVASNARVRYEPVFPDTGGGLARIDVFIDERQAAPRGWFPLAVLSARALLLDELVVDVAGSLGAGEVATAAWRWSTDRPRVALGLALPSPRWLPGIVSLDGAWERQSYATAPASIDLTLVREERRRVGLSLADWSSSRLRWQVGVALDQLQRYADVDERPYSVHDHVALEGEVDLRLADDHLAVGAAGGWWTSPGGGSRFSTGGLLAAWRSTDDETRPSWSARSEIEVASREAPLALWPGAGTGQGRGGLLRAHPLVTDGVLAGLVFGRGVGHGSLEYVRPVFHAAGRGLSVAGFMDVGRAWHRLDRQKASPLYIDAGIGVRVPAPGHDQTIRIDLAHGLRGGGSTFSASWGAAWPG